jgi:hypothetical protein
MGNSPMAFYLDIMIILDARKICELFMVLFNATESFESKLLLFPAFSYCGSISMALAENVTLLIYESGIIYDLGCKGAEIFFSIR